MFLEQIFAAVLPVLTFWKNFLQNGLLRNVSISAWFSCPFTFIFWGVLKSLLLPGCNCNKYKWNASSVYNMSCHGTHHKPFRLKTTVESLLDALHQY